MSDFAPVLVSVREENDLEGEILGRYEPHQLKPLVEFFKTQVTYLSDTCDRAVFSHSQFVHGKKCGVYFEIVVSIDEGKDNNG